MSSSVVSLPSESLKEPCAISCGRPIAMSTWDGSSVADEHAEPVDAQMPRSSSFNIRDSPSINCMAQFSVPGSLSVGWPLNIICFILSNKPC